MILSLFTFTNKIFSKSEQYENITPEITGIINCCCKILSLISDNEKTIPVIMNTTIPIELANILKQVPIQQIKPIHFDLIDNASILFNTKINQQLYQLGIIQILSRFLNHISSKIVEIIVSIISNIIFSGDNHCSSCSDCKISYLHNINHPYFEQLQKDGTIQILEQILLKHQQNENIQQNTINSLSQLYKYLAFPSQLLDITLDFIIRSIKVNNYGDINIVSEIESLKYLSYHQDNHNSILRYNILQQLILEYDKYDNYTQQYIIILFNYIYEIGNSYTREQIKQIIPTEKIQMMINRQKYIGIFSYMSNDGEQKDDAFQLYQLNLLLLKLLSWQNEEQKMNQILTIKNELVDKYKKLEHNQEEQYKMDNFSILKTNINKNEEILFKSVKMMISIIQEIKDYELIQGSSLIVSEGIYSIQFHQIQRWDEFQLIQTIDQLQIFINDSNNETIFNLIDENICLSLDYIINECQQNISLQLKEKTVYLVLSIAEHGVLMSRDYEYNYFFDQLDRNYVTQSIQTILECEINTNENNDINLINERIKLYSAISYGFIFKQYDINENILNICSTILFNKLMSFIHQIKQQSIISKNQASNEIDKNNEFKLYSEEIELMEKILLALGCLGSDDENAQFMNINFKIHEIILPLIHINCGCSQCISLSDQQSFTNIISYVYFSLAKLMQHINQQQIYNLNLQHNIFNHLNSFIFTTTDENNINNELIQASSSSYIFNQKTNALYLLQSMMSLSNQIRDQLFLNSNLIEFIIKFAQGKKIQNLTTNESKLIQNRCLRIIAEGNKNCSIELIINQIHKYKQMEIVSKIMSCSGGDGSDDDYVLSSVLTILINQFESLSQQNNEYESIQIENELKDEIEKEGIYEEADNYLFHTDNRQYFGIKQYGIYLKNLYEKQQQIQDDDDDEDQNDNENDEQN